MKQDALCSVDVAESVGKRVSFDLQSVNSDGGGVVHDGVSTVESYCFIRNSKKIPQNFCYLIYLKSVLLYGCETLLVTNEIQHKIQTFLNRCLRYILRIW